MRDNVRVKCADRLFSSITSYQGYIAEDLSQQNV